MIGSLGWFALMLISLVIAATPIGIGVLCWVWMKGSRASQARMEERNQEIVDLLKEQNSLLRALGESKQIDV